MDAERRLEQMVEVLRDFGVDSGEHILHDDVLDRVLIPRLALFAHLDRLDVGRRGEDRLPPVFRRRVLLVLKVFVQLNRDFCLDSSLLAEVRRGRRRG